jgi:hypothetical protein
MTNQSDTTGDDHKRFTFSGPYPGGNFPPSKSNYQQIEEAIDQLKKEGQENPKPRSGTGSM